MSIINMERLSFMDRCRVVCLYYIKEVSKLDDNLPPDKEQVILNIIDKEIESVQFNTHDLIAAAKSLSLMQQVPGDVSAEVFASAIADLTDSAIDESTFRLTVSKFLEVIQSWDHIALIFYFTYCLICKLDASDLINVLDASTRFCRSDARIFIEEKGGWENVASQLSSSGILSSLVMVHQPDDDMEMESSHFPTEPLQIVPSPPDSPPFSLVTANVDDEQESLNSATPPELVERPPMTSSLMQMMGAGDVPDIENAVLGGSSTNIEFEMVASITNKKSDKIAEPVYIEPSKPARPESPSKLNQSAEQHHAAPKDNGEVVSVIDYIPHITVGVAAAAACIGFFILKKNT